MSILSIILVIVLVAAILFVVIAGFSARTIIAPGRNPAWSDPKREVGLAFEDIAFPSQDGTPLKGWFIPSPTGARGPAIVFVHGWPWCRMGTRQQNPLNDLPGSRPINLMPLAKTYHDAGYHVLMYDMSNFGVSGSRGVYTSGLLESRDLIGALDYLGKRSEVDLDRIGTIGFSVGGTVVCFALPVATRIRAAIAVQPTTPEVFSGRYGQSKFGPLSTPLNALTELFYRIAGGMRLRFLQPALVLPGARDTPVLFVQGTGDQWGSMEDVQRMVAATPRGTAIYPETSHRFEGYTYMIDHPDISLRFFAEHLAGAATPRLASATAPA